MNIPTSNHESPWPHRLAVLLCCATLALIWAGGMVTTTKAGMSVPDWPNTFGYNLFLYPWQTWVYGPADVFVEHGHRLLASLVGLLTIVLLVVVCRNDSRPWMRWVAVGALAGVIGQGVLGGMRVVLGEALFGKIHGCVGPAFFAYTVALAAFTSRYWRDAAPATADARAGKLHRLAILTAGIAYLQIVFGAQLRHLPAGADPGFFRTMLWAHLFTAAALLVHIGLLAIFVGRQFRGISRLSAPALGLIGLIGVQVLLGVAAYVTHYGWPAWVGYRFAQDYTVQAQGYWQHNLTTAHVAVGSLIFGTSVLVSLRSLRLFRAVAQPAAAGALMLGAMG